MHSDISLQRNAIGRRDVVAGRCSPMAGDQPAVAVRELDLLEYDAGPAGRRPVEEGALESGSASVGRVLRHHRRRHCLRHIGS
jgi:hypothetical protein